MKKLFTDYLVNEKVSFVINGLTINGLVPIGVARGGAQGARAPPIKIPLTTKSYDNIAWRCLVAVFFQ